MWQDEESEKVASGMRNSLPIDMFDWPFSYGLSHHIAAGQNTTLLQYARSRLGKPVRKEEHRDGRMYSIWEFDTWRCRVNNERGADVEVFVDDNDEPIVNVSESLESIAKAFQFNPNTTKRPFYVLDACPYDELSSKFGPFRSVKVKRQAQNVEQSVSLMTHWNNR